MDADHQLIKQLENGYRMEKPEYAPNAVGDIINSCWRANPKQRPTFVQLEEMVSVHLEASVSSYYLNLNDSYAKFNEEKDINDPDQCVGLGKILQDNAKFVSSLDKSSTESKCCITQAVKDIGSNFTK